MEEHEHIRAFIDDISLTGRLAIDRVLAGLILTSLPIIGGGNSCVVIMADEHIIRLITDGSRWTAERLIVASDER